ncbi:hypothetical protein [Burkholderia gladioli]|nr:hypothetical protein [Burkholderia gladioli]
MGDENGISVNNRRDAKPPSFLLHYVLSKNRPLPNMRATVPKNHPALVGDKSLQARLKTLEDRIEQSYQVHQLTQTLIEIVEIIGHRQSPARPAEVPQEIMDTLRQFVQNTTVPEHMRQLNADRDAISDMVRRNGKGYVLGLLSHRLRLGLEVLFAGLVVSYIQMFEGADGRSKIDKRKFFKGNNEIENAHETFDMLRNKQYAHKELAFDRHRICYTVDGSGQIAIDPNAPQMTREYHLESSGDLLRLLKALHIHLSEEIKDRSAAILERLSDEQKHVLLEHAGQSEGPHDA